MENFDYGKSPSWQLPSRHSGFPLLLYHPYPLFTRSRVWVVCASMDSFLSVLVHRSPYQSYSAGQTRFGSDKGIFHRILWIHSRATNGQEDPCPFYF